MTDFPTIGWLIIAASFIPFLVLCASIARINSAA